jgi:hypothetical protein
VRDVADSGRAQQAAPLNGFKEKEGNHVIALLRFITSLRP